MNHEATIATLNMQLDNCAKDLYEKDNRIAELERQLEEASSPAVEQQLFKAESIDSQEFRKLADAYHCVNEQDEVEPTYYAMVYFIDAEIERQVKAALAAPQAADTDKVREALSDEKIMSIRDEVWQSVHGDDEYDAMDIAFARAVLKASMAAQAPVREVPEGREIFGWIIVNEDTREHDGGEVYTDKYEADNYMENRCLPGWQLEPIYRVFPAAPVQQEGV